MLPQCHTLFPIFCKLRPVFLVQFLMTTIQKRTRALLFPFLQLSSGFHDDNPKSDTRLSKLAPGHYGFPKICNFGSKWSHYSFPKICNFGSKFMTTIPKPIRKKNLALFLARPPRFLVSCFEFLLKKWTEPDFDKFEVENPDFFRNPYLDKISS